MAMAVLMMCGVVSCGREAVEVLASVGSRTDSLVERSTCALCDLATCAAVRGRRNVEWGQESIDCCVMLVAEVS